MDHSSGAYGDGVAHVRVKASGSKTLESLAWHSLLGSSSTNTSMFLVWDALSIASRSKVWIALGVWWGGSLDGLLSVCKQAFGLTRTGGCSSRIP